MNPPEADFATLNIQYPTRNKECRRKEPPSVFAKATTQQVGGDVLFWIPAFAGMTRSVKCKTKDSTTLGVNCRSRLF